MFISYKFLTLASLVLCTPAAPTQPNVSVATIENDLNGIHAAIKTLDASIDKFDGTLTEAATVYTNTKAVSTLNKSALTDVKAASTFSTTDGATILSLIKSVAPDIEKTLQDIVTQKAEFTHAGAASTVASSLKDLRTDTANLGTALTAKAPTSLQGDAGAVQKEIDGAFATALQAYGSA